MEEEKQENQEQQENREQQEKEKLKELLRPENLIATYGKGKLSLQQPIQDGSRTVEELEFDFSKLTGQEYAEAMDTDSKADGFKLSVTQALALFAAAAAKETGGLSSREIQARIGIMDAQKGAQLASIFFSASNRAGNTRISKR